MVASYPFFDGATEWAATPSRWSPTSPPPSASVKKTFDHAAPASFHGLRVHGRGFDGAPRHQDLARRLEAIRVGVDAHHVASRLHLLLEVEAALVRGRHAEEKTGEPASRAHSQRERDRQ